MCFFKYIRTLLWAWETHTYRKLTLVCLKSNWSPLRYDQTCLSVPDINAASIPSLGGTLLFSWAIVQLTSELPETRLQSVLGCEKASLAHDMLFLHLVPIVGDFFTSLLYICCFFFVLFFLVTFLLWIYSPESCYSPSKTFSNQMRIEVN